jgi:hypothetical protein
MRIIAVVQHSEGAPIGFGTDDEIAIRRRLIALGWVFTHHT